MVMRSWQPSVTMLLVVYASASVLTKREKGIRKNVIGACRRVRAGHRRAKIPASVTGLVP